VYNVRERLRRLNADPWKDYWSCQQRLTAQTIKRVHSL
jgi:hypothetical protein